MLKSRIFLKGIERHLLGYQMVQQQNLFDYNYLIYKENYFAEPLWLQYCQKVFYMQQKKPLILIIVLYNEVLISIYMDYFLISFKISFLIKSYLFQTKP